MGFSDAKNAPCPPYTPLGTIESSKGLRPSRALPSFLTSAESAMPTRDFQKASGNPQNSGTSIYGSRIRRPPRRQQVAVGTADRRQQMRAGFSLPARKLRWGSGGARSEAVPPPAGCESAMPTRQLVKRVLTSWWTGKQAPRPGAAPQIYDLSRRQFRQGRNLKTQRVFSLPATLTSLR